MSALVHYSDAKDGVIPKRFLCGKKTKSGNEWTRYPWIVECAQCRAKTRAAGLQQFAASSADQKEKL